MRRRGALSGEGRPGSLEVDAAVGDDAGSDVLGLVDAAADVEDVCWWRNSESAAEKA